MSSICVGGWEVQLQNNGEQKVLGPFPSTFYITGYQFSLSMVSLADFVVGPSQVLFTALVAATPPVPIVPVPAAAPGSMLGGEPPVIAAKSFQAYGTNVTHANCSPGVGGIFCAAILKTSGAVPVNLPLIVPAGPVIAMVPVNGCIVFQAAHSGFAIDFEHQGTIFCQ